MTRMILSLYICVGLVFAGQSVGPARAAEVRSKAGIENAIDKTVKSFSFKGTFAQCLEKLSKLAKVRIVGDWKTLEIAGVKKGKRISVSADGARASQLLDVAMAMARARPKGTRLGWYIDVAAGAIRVTTQRAALSSRRMANLPIARPAPARPAGPNFTFRETPLSAVIQAFRELTKLNFHVNWRALAEINVDRDTPVTVAVSGVSMARALDLVTDELSDNLDKLQRAYWIHDGGVVKISTGTALNTGLRTQVYDIVSLLMPIVSVKMPRRIGLRGLSDSNTNDRRYDRRRDTGRGGDRDRGRGIGTVRTGAGIDMIGAGGDSDRAGEREQAEKLKENIIGVIKDSIGQDMWEPSGKGSVKIIGNRLVISQTLLGYKLLGRSLRTRRR